PGGSARVGRPPRRRVSGAVSPRRTGGGGRGRGGRRVPAGGRPRRPPGAVDRGTRARLARSGRRGGPHRRRDRHARAGRGAAAGARSRGGLAPAVRVPRPPAGVAPRNRARPPPPPLVLFDLAAASTRPAPATDGP